MDVVVEDIVSSKGSENLDTAWVHALKRVPSLVCTLDMTSISHNVLTGTCKAPSPDMFKLFAVCL